MRFEILIAILFVALSGKVFSQSDSTICVKNTLYGPGGYGSVNFERIFLIKKQFSLTARIGLGTYHVKDYTNKFNPDIIIPIAINGSYGKDHKAEFGIGQSISSIVQADEADLNPTRNTNFSTFFSMGYRYKKTTGHLFFRIAYTPLIEYNKTWRNWGGVSFGYVF